MHSDHFFSVDYESARQRFLDAAQACGAQLDRVEIGAKGPAGENLSIDFARLGELSQAKRIVVHTSGVHGVEGYVGSAIQLELLSDFPNFTRSDAAIFVHSVNPYGMAWLRRWNENNVDLNRNFIVSKRWPRTASSKYQSICGLLNPETPPPKWDGFEIRAAYAIARYGYKNLQQAIAEGQYEFPRGLFFGGVELEESSRVLLDWLRVNCEGANEVTLVDVHSGLGRFADDVMLVGEKSDLSRLGELKSQFQHRVSYSGKSDVDYQTSGGLLDAVEVEIEGPSWLTLCHEFGTRSGLQVLKSLRAENRWHHYGDSKEIDHWSKRQLLSAFCPEKESWRTTVLAKGREVFQTFI